MLRKATTVGKSVIPRLRDRSVARVALGLAVPFAVTVLLLLPFLSATQSLALMAMVPFLIVASATDLVTHEVPDWCSLGLLLIGVVLLPTQLWPLWHIGAALAALGVLWAGSEIYFRQKSHEALGLGDVKLIASGTLIVGPVGLWLLMLIAPVGGIAYVLLRRERALPFAPFISYGLIVAFVGATILTGGRGG